MEEVKIENPRAEIDAIDTEILRLLNRRAEIALRVGAVKKRDDVSLCDVRREREVLVRLIKENPGPFDAHGIENIFRRIIDESLHLQQKTYFEQTKGKSESENNFSVSGEKPRVAFQGEKGSFSEEAVWKIFGDACETVPCKTFEDLYKSVDDKKADYILSPLENSLVGSVHRCYDLLLNGSLNIVAETVLPISHYLIGCPDAEFEEIKTVESHPVALSQCERFFATHPEIKRLAGDDTAGSVKKIIEENDTRRAAIGGKRSAEIYGGKILREHIEDHAENFTRFVLLSKETVEGNQNGGKISLVVRLKNQPGALHNALRPFVRRGIDLTKIESRPVKNSPSQFNFYVDLQAPASESELKSALDEIREQAEDVRYLGQYSRVENKPL